MPNTNTFGQLLTIIGVSLGAQMVKRLPTMRETGVRSLGWEDLLEKEMATHSSYKSLSLDFRKKVRSFSLKEEGC